jgi:hypothetical protein
MHVSDRVVQSLGLPLETLFRIYPTVGNVEDRDPDDGSYSITWEENKQYWFDIVYEESRDRRSNAKEIQMVDAFNRMDTFVVPTAANATEIVELWRRVLEVPEEIHIGARSGNGFEYFWGYRTAADVIPCTLRTHNMHGDSQIFPGPDNFKADNNNNNTFTWCGPSGVSDCTGQRPVGPKAGRYTSETLSYDSCHTVPFNLLTRVWKENLRGGKRLRPRFWTRDYLARAHPFALNRPHLASLQLRSLSSVIG